MNYLSFFTKKIYFVVVLRTILMIRPMISYHNEDIDFIFKHKRLNNKWLSMVAGSEMKKIGEIAVIFCSDHYIIDINRRYLGHDYFTDIITFDYTEGDKLSGDLFISIDTVKENAALYGADFATELNRVIVHGLLHLIGYDDHTPEQTAQMRAKEDYYLSIRENIQ